MSNRRVSGVSPYEQIRRPERRNEPIDVKAMLMEEIVTPDAQEGYLRYGPGNARVAASAAVGNSSGPAGVPVVIPRGGGGSGGTADTGSIIIPPFPRSFAIHNDWGVADQYLNCDSRYKDSSSDMANGLLVFSVVLLNNGRPIDTIIEMELENFYIPNVDNFPFSLPEPQTFFFKRNTILLKDASSQAVFGANNSRYHWEFDVEPQGIANLIVPTRPKFIFGKPFISLNQLSFVFQTPTGLVNFPQDTYTVVPLRNTFPARFLLVNSFIPQQMDYLVAPVAPTAALGGGGNLSTGHYRWAVTFVTRQFDFNTLTYSVFGETDEGTRSNYVVAAAGDSGVLTNVPIDVWSANTGPPGGPAVNIRAQTTRRIYRTTANGNTFYFVGEINDNTTTTFTDLISDVDLVANNIPGVNSTRAYTAPTVNTTGGPAKNIADHGLTLFFPLATPNGPNVAIAGGGGGLSPAAAGQYRWVLTFVNAQGESVPGEIVTSPVPNVLNDRAVLTNIPIGDPGTLARNVYRTTVGGSTFKFVFTINNNTQTTFVDTYADAGLGASPPAIDGTGGASYTVYMTGLNIGDSVLNTTFNSPSGYLVTAVDASTVETTYSVGVLPNFYYSQVVTNGTLFIGYRRIAFTIRFRCLTQTEQNHITPI